MVGKRISQEFINLQHRHILAMITDEAMTSQKCIYRVHQTKKATRNIYDMIMERLWNPNPLGRAPLSAPIIIVKSLVMPQP
jgi:hypothetical protein